MGTVQRGKRQAMNNEIIIGTLREIASANNGVLLPERVVEAARPKESPLHDCFTWDDDKAAHEYRLWQARTLIRTTVRLLEVDGKQQPVRMFVSLTTDRQDGGYREMVSVMLNKTHREQLLADAVEEMKRFEAKYEQLVELSDLIRRMKIVRESLAG